MCSIAADFVREELLDGFVVLPELGAVALVEDEDDAFGAQGLGASPKVAKRQDVAASPR